MAPWSSKVPLGFPGKGFAMTTTGRLERADRDELDEWTAARYRERVDCAEPAPPLLDEVVHRYLWLADGIARRRAGHAEDREDIQQVARFALYLAALRYDPGRGAFIPFAKLTIEGEIKRHFRDRTWYVRPPRRIQELTVRIGQIWPDLSQALHHEPSVAELAEALGAEPGLVREALTAGGARYPAHSDLDDGSITIAARGDHEDTRLVVESVLGSLTGEQQDLLRLRFYDDLTQSQIAARLGISQMQVSRLLARILATLRRAISEPG